MSQPSKCRIPKSHAKTAYGLLTEIENLAAVEPRRIAMTVCLLRGSGLCIAGWTYVLRGFAKPNVYNSSDTAKAGQILGLTPEQQKELFYPENLLYHLEEKGLQTQTLTHARAVIKHIRAFKAKYSRQLRAHRLPEVKSNV